MTNKNVKVCKHPIYISRKDLQLWKHLVRNIKDAMKDFNANYVAESNQPTLSSQKSVLPS